MKSRQEKELGNFRANFFSMTSHQFRTPLSTIYSSAELLENYGSQWPREKKLMHLDRIKGATQRLNTMLDDILTLGRMDSDAEQIVPEPVNVGELVSSLVRGATSYDNSRHNIEIVLPDSAILISTDAHILERIIDNLISNALKYSAQETVVTISCEKSWDGVYIEVRDNGIGISEEDLKLIFQPFHRGSNVVDTPGSGLGLMIVEKSVRKIFGTIQVNSQLAQGSVFRIFIPDMDQMSRDRTISLMDDWG